MEESIPGTGTNNHSLAAIAFNYVIVALMMVTIAITIVQAGQYFAAGWDGRYLPVLIFLISLEALISRRLIRSVEGLFGWALFRGGELIVILLAIKITLYIVNGFTQMLQDFSSLQQNSLAGIFNGEYLAIVTIALILWFLSGLFAEHLIELEEDRELLEQERHGYANIDRESSRRGLISLVFSIGGGMLLLVSVISLRFPFMPQIGFRPSIVLLLAYFILGFVLLSQSQLSLLKASWYIQSIPITPAIASRWAPYSIALLIVISLIVLLLPTEYSLGFLALVQLIVNLAMTLFIILQVLLLSPLLAFLNFLASLLGKDPVMEQQAPPPLPPVVPPNAPDAAPPWLDIVKSVLFWSIFILVIAYAVRQYTSQRGDLLKAVKKLPFLIWFNTLWRSFTSGFKRANNRASEIIKEGMRRLRQPQTKAASRINLFNALSSRLPPRQRILLTYLQLIRWNAKNGIGRKDSQTPYEYARMLVNTVPAILPDIDAITKIFMEARYTRHDVTLEMAQTAHMAMQNIQGQIETFLEQKENRP